jgi:RimJ/RimL family protein N-acetyltransferase
VSFQKIETANTTLVNPFPVNKVDQIIKWLHFYNELITHDDRPQTDEEWEAFILDQLATSVSWKVLDKDKNLIGVLWADRNTLPLEVTFHFIGDKSVWGNGLMEEASNACIAAIFKHNPKLLRLGAFIFDANKHAKNFLIRLGFKQDGLFEAFATHQGIPQAVAHFGYVRT